MTPDARARLQHNVRMADWWRLAGQTVTLDADGRPVDVWTLRTPQPPDEEPTALTFAYADPPYVGCSHLYPEHPESAKWDNPAEHVALMHQLDADYDGWALSLSVPSLAALLVDAPAGTRVAAWVKPFAAYKRNVRVAYTWEPVLWKRTHPRRDGDPVGRDHLSCNITMRKGLTGAKPEAFARWLLVLLGWQQGDTLVDLFPGTGVVGRVADEPRLAL